MFMYLASVAASENPGLSALCPDTSEVAKGEKKSEHNHAWTICLPQNHVLCCLPSVGGRCSAWWPREGRLRQAPELSLQPGEFTVWAPLTLQTQLSTLPGGLLSTAVLRLEDGWWKGVVSLATLPWYLCQDCHAFKGSCGSFSPRNSAVTSTWTHWKILWPLHQVTQPAILPALCPSQFLPYTPLLVSTPLCHLV